MKKIYTSLLAALMLFGVASCTHNNDNPTPVVPEDDDGWVTDDDDSNYPDKKNAVSVSISDAKTYTCGDVYSTSNKLHIVITYKDGTTRNLPYSKADKVYVTYDGKSCKDTDKFTNVGTYNVQVKYNGIKSEIIDIAVVSSVSSMTVSDNKTYHIGDVYSLCSNLTAVGTYQDGTSFSVGYSDLDYATCYYGEGTSQVQDLATGFGTTGTYTIKCSYKGFVADTYTIDVVGLSTELSNQAIIKFTGTKSSSGYSSGSTIVSNYTQVSGNVSLSSIDVLGVYGGSGVNPVAREGIRVGNTSTAGSLTLHFNEYFNYKTISLLVRPFEGDTNSSISFKVSSDGLNSDTTLTCTKDNNNPVRVVSMNSISSTKAGTNLTLSCEPNNAFYLYAVGFDFTDVNPTSLSLDQSTLALSTGDSRQLAVTFADNVTKRGITWTSSDNSVATVDDNGVVSGLAAGSTTITATSTANTEAKATCQVTVTALETLTTKTELSYHYQDLSDHALYTTDVAPSVGNPKLLVIPVWFTDSNEVLTTESAKASMISDVETAYFGSEDETGWESVKTYYSKDSFGKVNIDGTVCPEFYECGKSSTEMGTATAMETASLLKDAVAWYKDKYNTTLDDYDTDNDGWLDGVMLIYAYGDYSSLGRSDLDNLWAYCYWAQDSSTKSDDNPGVNSFFWASYDFMENGKASNIKVDAHTYIHEMGHIFGLNDYYDYNGVNYAAGMFSMQDFNVGSHDPYSAMALGWTNPYVANKPCTVTLNKYEESGDILLVTPEETFSGSPFDEYILLELYSPTGLNERDCTYAYEGHAYQKGPNAVGFRIWHIDSRLMWTADEFLSDEESYWSSDRITTNPNNPTKFYDIATSNTTYKSGDSGHAADLAEFRNYKQLHLLQHDGGTGFTSSSYFQESDLWKAGDTFTLADYSTSFYKGTTFNNGLEFPFKIVINSIGEDSATVSIVYA